MEVTGLPAFNIRIFPRGSNDCQSRRSNFALENLHSVWAKNISAAFWFGIIFAHTMHKFSGFYSMIVCCS